MFQRDVADCAGADGVVTWTFCNRGHSAMALNWWRWMERACPDAKPLVICLDAATDADLTREGVSTNLVHPPHHVEGEILRYRESIAWTRVTAMKIIIAHDLLRRGLSLLYTDTDVVAMKDPRDITRPALERRDVVFQVNDVNAICSGIFAVRPTPATLALFDMETPDLPRFELDNPWYGDQNFIQQRVAALAGRLSWEFLPAREFPNGFTWYANRDALRDAVRLIHYNCREGNEAKIAEMKIDGNWTIS